MEAQQMSPEGGTAYGRPLQEYSRLKLLPMEDHNGARGLGELLPMGTCIEQCLGG